MMVAVIDHVLLIVKKMGVAMVVVMTDISFHIIEVRQDVVVSIPDQTFPKEQQNMILKPIENMKTLSSLVTYLTTFNGIK